MNKKAIAIAYSFVGEVVLLIVGGMVVGHFIDNWLNTTVLFTIILMLFGVGVSLYLLVKRVNKLEDKHERE